MIRAAIVGLGRWGQNLVASVAGSEHIRFVAGATHSPDKARDFVAKHGLALHDSYEALLADSATDAVVLATPHTLHARQIVAAAIAGKHVFCEKPLALTAREAAAAVRACTDRGVTLAVGYNWRFQPALKAIRGMLGDGRLGRLLHIEGNFCGPSVYRFGSEHWRQSREEAPAGGMTGRGVHLVDAMLYLSGRIESVYARSRRSVRDSGLDDTTSMLFSFAGGASGYLGTVIATAETWRLQVFGSNGWAEVGGVEHLGTWPLKTCTIDRDNLHRHQPPDIMTFDAISTERAELEFFAQAALERRPLAAPGGDEVHGVAVFEAILRSARDGSTLRVG